VARIAGITIPTDKQAQYALTYVFGVGLTRSRQTLDACEINREARVKDLTDAELTRIRDFIGESFIVEGELQRIVSTNVKRLKDIGSYRGSRHKASLPSRGQRTRTNARTRRGRKVAVGGAQPKAATKT